MSQTPAASTETPANPATQATAATQIDFIAPSPFRSFVVGACKSARHHHEVAADGLERVGRAERAERDLLLDGGDLQRAEHLAADRQDFARGRIRQRADD